MLIIPLSVSSIQDEKEFVSSPQMSLRPGSVRKSKSLGLKNHLQLTEHYCATTSHKFNELKMG